MHDEQLPRVKIERARDCRPAAEKACVDTLPSATGLISWGCALADRTLLPAGQSRGAARARACAWDSDDDGMRRRRVLMFAEGRFILPRRKAQNSTFDSREDVAATRFRRPFGARRSDQARRGGATAMSPRCMGLSSARHAKRPTEAGTRTRTAVVENKSKSSARSANGLETLPETRRARLCERFDNRERRRASDGGARRRRCHEGQRMGQQMMGIHAREMAPRAGERRAFPIRFEAEISLEQGSLDSSPALSLLAPRAPHHPERATSRQERPWPQRLERPWPQRLERPWPQKQDSGDNSGARARTYPDRPLRKPLRVKCLGDKLGYPRATFVLPLTFLHQP
jgi:hypothetical protein